MAEKLFAIHIKGTHKDWIFETMVDPKYLNDWWDDGLRLFEVANIIPTWVVDLGIPLRFFCWLQNLFMGGG